MPKTAEKKISVISAEYAVRKNPDGSTPIRTQQSGICYLGISLTNDMFSGPVFFEELKALKKSFKKLIVVVGDSLHRHNVLRDTNFSLEEAIAEAKAFGQTWLHQTHSISISINEVRTMSHEDMIREIFSEEGTLEILSWDAYLPSEELMREKVVAVLPSEELMREKIVAVHDQAQLSSSSSDLSIVNTNDFTEILTFVRQLYLNTAQEAGSFSDYVYQVAQSIKLPYNPHKSHAIRTQHTLDYILEEIAVFVLFGKQNPNSSLVYPGTNVKRDLVNLIYRAMDKLWEKGELSESQQLYADYINVNKSTLRVWPEGHKKAIHPAKRGSGEYYSEPELLLSTSPPSSTLASSSYSSEDLGVTKIKERQGKGVEEQEASHSDASPVPSPRGIQKSISDGSAVPPVLNSQELVVVQTIVEQGASSSDSSPMMSPRELAEDCYPASVATQSQSSVTGRFTTFRQPDTRFKDLLGKIQTCAQQGHVDIAVDALNTTLDLLALYSKPPVSVPTGPKF